MLLAGLAGVTTLVTTAAPAQAADTGTGETWRVNLGPGLVEANKPSERARISHDGKHVCYQTNASNLAAGDPALPDVYWSDLTDPAHPVTKRVSIGWDGSNANDQSTFCEISGDGRYVVFSSIASNLVKGNTQRGTFIRDMLEPDLSKATRNVAPNSDRPVVSDDGRYVSYNTLAPFNDVWVKDMQTGRTLQLTANPSPGHRRGEPPPGDLRRRHPRGVRQRPRPRRQRHQRHPRRLPRRPAAMAGRRDDGARSCSCRSGSTAWPSARRAAVPASTAAARS